MGLDEHLNFFVGPNGSGKTSVFRALKVLEESFEAADSGTRKVLGYLYSVHASPRQIGINVKVCAGDLGYAFEKRALATRSIAPFSPAGSRLRGSADPRLPRRESRRR
jgi:energy-coupling factor transporter ATP-binding protein EcfA2